MVQNLAVTVGGLIVSLVLYAVLCVLHLPIVCGLLQMLPSSPSSTSEEL